MKEFVNNFFSPSAGNTFADLKEIENNTSSPPEYERDSFNVVPSSLSSSYSRRVKHVVSDPMSYVCMLLSRAYTFPILLTLTPYVLVPSILLV